MFPPGFTCPAVLWIRPDLTQISLTGLSPCLAGLPMPFHYPSLRVMSVQTPGILRLLVWPLPLSLATTSGISFDFSSSRYLDVSVPGVPHVTLCIYVTFHDSSPWVFPHSEICGSKLICSSPQLIAAYHVLHRLLMPRHSPYALIRLNFPISDDSSSLGSLRSS